MGPGSQLRCPWPSERIYQWPSLGGSHTSRSDQWPRHRSGSQGPSGFAGRFLSGRQPHLRVALPPPCPQCLRRRREASAGRKPMPECPSRWLFWEPSSGSCLDVPSRWLLSGVWRGLGSTIVMDGFREERQGLLRATIVMDDNLSATASGPRRPVSSQVRSRSLRQDFRLVGTGRRFPAIPASR